MREECDELVDLVYLTTVRCLPPAINQSKFHESARFHWELVWAPNPFVYHVLDHGNVVAVSVIDCLQLSCQKLRQTLHLEIRYGSCILIQLVE